MTAFWVVLRFNGNENPAGARPKIAMARTATACPLRLVVGNRGAQSTPGRTLPVYFPPTMWPVCAQTC